jgi:hypothetical protein
MQSLGELARVRADEPPSPPTEKLSAGRQLNAIFALALLAAPSVCPMKADIAISLSEARFKANGGDYWAFVARWNRIYYNLDDVVGVVEKTWPRWRPSVLRS